MWRGEGRRRGVGGWTEIIRERGDVRKERGERVRRRVGENVDSG